MDAHPDDLANRDFYRFTSPGGEAVYFGWGYDTSWITVYALVGSQWHRFGYSREDARWSGERQPAGALRIAAQIALLERQRARDVRERESDA